MNIERDDSTNKRVTKLTENLQKQMKAMIKKQAISDQQLQGLKDNASEALKNHKLRVWRDKIAEDNIKR